MKYLIVGLGNPGAEYDNTRHNIGMHIVDALAEASTIFFSPDRHGEVAKIKHKGRTLILLKPNTFMNLSGKAVNYWMQAEKIPLEKVLIITDDIALPFGSIRLKAKGSDGGHNGLKSINEHLNTNQYPRLRFGVGNDFPKGKQSDYVLGTWKSEEQEALTERVKICTELVKAFSVNTIGRVMSDYNGR